MANNTTVAKRVGRPPGKKSAEKPPKLYGQTEIEKGVIRQFIGQTIVAYKQDQVQSDEELIQRLDAYFVECGQTGRVPTVEEMCLTVGLTTANWKNIEYGRSKGFSSRTKEIMKRAKEVVKAVDARLVMTGELNPIVYFFRAKNYYDMRDQQDISVQAIVQNDEREMSADDIAKRYLTDVKTVEATFPEDAEQNAEQK